MWVASRAGQREQAVSRGTQACVQSSSLSPGTAQRTGIQQQHTGMQPYRLGAAVLECAASRAARLLAGKAAPAAGAHAEVISLLAGLAGVVLIAGPAGQLQRGREGEAEGDGRAQEGLGWMEVSSSGQECCAALSPLRRAGPAPCLWIALTLAEKLVHPVGNAPMAPRCLAQHCT